MNGTPRILNRVLIGVLGVKLLAIGVLLILLASVPAVGVWWQSWAAGVWSLWRDLFERTRFPGRAESWLWIVVVLVLLLVIGAMVAWVAQQGKGRANLLVSEEDPGDVPGNVRIGSGVAEQALRTALADRPDLAGVTVATYEFRGEPGLRIRIQPRQGVAPPARGRGVRPRGSPRCCTRQAHSGAHPRCLRCAVEIRAGRSGPLKRP